MSDNTGPYCNLAQLLLAFAKAGQGSQEKVLLASRTVTVGNAGTFVITAPTLTPTVMDWIVQGDQAQQLTAVAGTLGTVADITNLANGEARLVRVVQTAAELAGFRSEAMAFIDRHTRQWFNARPVTMKVTGNNSTLFQLNVPIISIEYVKLNGDLNPLDVTTYHYGVSRTQPDDRRNPKILMVRQNIDILTLEPRVFLSERVTEIKGVFGFLEEDGTTPLMIQRAVLKLAVMRAINDPGTAGLHSAGATQKGAIKRERTDLHETEYFNPNEAAGSRNSGGVGTGLSGDDEIDDIIAAYRSPALIGGSIIEILFPHDVEQRW